MSASSFAYLDTDEPVSLIVELDPDHQTTLTNGFDQPVVRDACERDLGIARSSNRVLEGGLAK